MTNLFCAFVFCTSLFTKKHAHFTTPNHVSFSDIWHCGYLSNSFQKVPLVLRQKINTVDVLKSEHILFLFLQTAYKRSCSPRRDVVKVAPALLYLAMIDRLTAMLS